MAVSHYKGNKRPATSAEAQATLQENPAPAETPVAPQVQQAAQPEAPVMQQAQQSVNQEAPKMTNQRAPRDLKEILTNPSAYLGRGDRSYSSDSRAIALRNAFRVTQEKLVESNGADLKNIKFDIMDADVLNGQSMTTIVAYGSMLTAQNEKVTIVRPMLVSIKRDRRTSRQIMFNQRNVVIDQRPQDLVMTDYVAKVGNFVARRVENYGKIVNAGILTLPVSLDSTNEEVIEGLLVDNETRMLDAVSTLNDNTRMTLKSLKDLGAQLVVTPEYENKVKKTITGMPVRSDVTITMTARVRPNQQNGQQQQNFNNQNHQDNVTNIELCSLSGFIDLIPFRAAGQQQQPGMFGNNIQSLESLQCANAFFVITHSEQGSEARPNQMESFLMSIGNMFRVTSNGSWLSNFAPKFDGSRNLNDPTALGYWITGTRFTETDNKPITDMNSIQQMLKLYLKGDVNARVPSIGFMMDINPTGDNALLELPFLEVALNTPNADKAAKMIIRAADNLTGGLFSPEFTKLCSMNKSNGRIISYTGNQISLGEYTSDTGNKRDVRDMSNLAMLNLTEGNTQDFRAWFDTTDCSMDPSVMRVIRESVDKRYAGTNTDFDEFCYRCNFSVEFVVALYNAIENSGAQIQFQDSNYQNQQMYFGNMALSNSVINQTANAGMVNPGQQWSGNVGNIYGGNNTMYY